MFITISMWKFKARDWFWRDCELVHVSSLLQSARGIFMSA